MNYQEVFAWSLWLAVCFIAGSLMVALIASPLLPYIGLSSNITVLAQSAVAYAVILALFVMIPYVFFRRVISRHEAGIKWEPTWTDIMLAIGGGIIYLVLSMVLLWIAQHVPGFNSTEIQDVGITQLFGLDRFVGFVVFVVIGPIIEEVLFRGVLYGKLRANGLSAVATALIVSILFGLAHLQWNVGIDVFALSVIACAIREITGSVWGGIILHMLKNGIAFYLLFVA